MPEHDLFAKHLTEMCRDRGYLAKQLYAVFTSPIDDVDGMEAVMNTLPDHLAFQEVLDRDGVMFAAGPRWTDDEERREGEGLIVFAPRRLKKPNRLQRAIRCTCGAVRKFRVRPWLINEGAMSVRLNFATKSFEII